MAAHGKVIVASIAVAGILLSLGVVVRRYPRALKLLRRGEVHELRPRAAADGRSRSTAPRLLVLALDGVDRKLLYRTLDANELPSLAALLGGREGSRFPHASCFDRLVTVLPSTTMAAWTTVFTGVPPGVHGVTGNELFIRDRREIFAPAPVSFHDLSPMLAVYSSDALGRQLEVPILYERLRERDPSMRAWVAMCPVFHGADRLILPSPSALAEVFAAFLREAVADDEARKIYAELDVAVIETVIEEIEHEDVPDVLTLYVAGTDLFTHHAAAGPDEARRGYLRDVLDPLLGRLRDALARRAFLDDAYVVVLSDHGHTEVIHDDEHALRTEGADEPPELVRRMGYRLRPFEWNVATDDYDAVLAYNGAMAFVYLTDRSSSVGPDDRRDWTRRPRLREDVLPLADAFSRASAEGAVVPALRGTLDMVLVRVDGDEPYQVYVGGGQLQSVDDYLAAKPHPTYVDLSARLRDLGTGPCGDRAGDILLIAQNGNVDDPCDRYYFASKYRSWHGSPSRQDGEVPFIVAHPRRTDAELSAMLARVFGESPYMHRVADVLLHLRKAPC